MDRSAPVYYVAIRQPAEAEPTTTVEDTPPRPSKPQDRVRVQSGAINAAIPPFARATQPIQDARLRATAVEIINIAEEAAAGNRAPEAKSAHDKLTQLILYSQNIPFTGTGSDDTATVISWIQAAGKLRSALRLGTSRGGRRRGGAGRRKKPATVPVDISDLVTSFKFEDNERKVDKLSLTVDNFTVEQFDDTLFKRGNIIEFTFGYASGLAPIREAVIRKVTGGTQLTVEAHSRDVIMDRVKRRESYKNKTRSDVVRLIAERNGYAPEQLSVEDTTVVYEELIQPNLTDAQFLRKLANKEGFEFFVDYDGFHWHARNLEQAPIRKMVYYSDPGAGDIINFTVENDITRRPARVRVRGINPTTGESFTEVADDKTDTSRDVLQPTKVTEDLLFIDGVSGATSTGSREVDPPTQPIAHEQDVTSVPVDDATQAQVEAKRRFRKAQQRSVRMNLTIVGDPTIVGKSVLLLEGMNKRLSGRYYVQQIVHTITAGGTYTCQLKLITDGFGSSKKRGSGASSKGSKSSGEQTLFNALNKLRQAGQLTSDGNVRDAVLTAVNQIYVIHKDQTKGSYLQAANIALKLISTVQALGKSSTGEQKDAGKAIIHAAGAVAGICKRLAQQDPDKEAAGRLNEKPVQGEEKDGRIVIDPVTGGISS